MIYKNNRKMINQQPSTEKVKVQRLSRKGVLDKIIWETPHNKFYLYQLEFNNRIVYYGITNNPYKRLYDHLTLNGKNVFLNTYIADIGRNNIIMKIINSFNNINLCRKEEKECIKNSTQQLLNLQYTSKVKGKYCIILDTKTDKKYEFNSIRNALEFIGLKNKPGLSMFTFCNMRYFIAPSIEELNTYLKEKGYCKGKNVKTGEIKYFLNGRHASNYIGATRGHITAVLVRIKGDHCKFWLLSKVTEEFKSIKNIKIRNKIIYCINTDQYFLNSKIAAKYLQLSQSSIRRVCAGQRPHIKKYKFKYIEDIVRPITKVIGYKAMDN